jgi:hypothetical protein
MLKISRNMTRLASSGLAALLILCFAACRTYSVEAILTQPWPAAAPATFKDIAVGFIESGGSARSPVTQRNLYDSLTFTLQERGFIVLDYLQTIEQFKKTQTAADRLLTDAELRRATPELGSRLFAQGRVQEMRTESLTEEHVQVMVILWIYDARRGERIAELRLFAKDLEYNTGRETQTMARLLADRLDQLIAENAAGGR